MIKYIKVNYVYELPKSSYFSTKPLISGLIVSPKLIEVPITPQAVPSLRLSVSRLTEDERAVYIFPLINEMLTRNKAITR
jgi:hypothetical protein